MLKSASANIAGPAMVPPGRVLRGLGPHTQPGAAEAYLLNDHGAAARVNLWKTGIDQLLDTFHVEQGGSRTGRRVEVRTRH
jgi:hypothetical protein